MLLDQMDQILSLKQVIFWGCGTGLQENIYLGCRASCDLSLHRLATKSSLPQNAWFAVMFNISTFLTVKERFALILVICQTQLLCQKYTIKVDRLRLQQITDKPQSFASMSVLSLEVFTDTDTINW